MFELIVGVAIGALLFSGDSDQRHGGGYQPKKYGGHIVVWFGLTWSLELYQQANKRLHRPVQSEPVIMRALKDKSVGQDTMMDAVKARLEKWRGQ